jgi:hypothetical protein
LRPCFHFQIEKEEDFLLSCCWCLFAFGGKNGYQMEMMMRKIMAMAEAANYCVSRPTVLHA